MSKTTTSTQRKKPYMVSSIEAWKERTRKDAFTGWGVPTEPLLLKNVKNQLKTQVGKKKENLNRWDMTDSMNCECGKKQTLILECIH